MLELFFDLLRSNFRCGRMRRSRTVPAAGHIAVPALCVIR
jgi:hypothetical protein